MPQTTHNAQPIRITAPPDIQARPHPARFSRLQPLSFYRHPMLYTATACALGILADHALPWRQPLLRLTCTLLLLLLAWLSTIIAPRLQIFATLLTWISAGSLIASLALGTPQQQPLDAYADHLLRTIQGTVTAVQRVPTQQDDADFEFGALPDIESNKQLWRIDIQLSQMEERTPDISTMVPMQGGVRLLASLPQPPALQCGDTINLPVQMRPPQRYRDPGVWQYADYLAAQGIRVRATTRVASIQPFGHAPPSWGCRIRSAQQWAASRLAATVHHAKPAWLWLSSNDTATLSAMLLGDRSALSHALRLSFEQTGTFHLLVVAGLHIGLAAAFLLWIFAKLRLGRTSSTLLAIPLLTVYAILTGFGQPVQRALFMTIVFLLARMLSRRSSSLNALGWAALAMLLFDPASLFTASFQMTVLAVIAIGGIGHAIAERTFLPYLRASQRIHLLSLDTHLAPRLAQYRVLIRLTAQTLSKRHGRRIASLLAFTLHLFWRALELILLSLVAELLMALPMMAYFHRITLMALPANLLTLLLIAPLMLATAILFVLALCNIHWAIVFSPIAALLLHAVQTIVQTFSTMPAAAWRQPDPALWKSALVILCIALCLIAVRMRRSLAIAGPLALIAALGILIWPAPAQPPTNSLQLTAIDVGQGDSLLLVSPQNRTMLIDAGGSTGHGEDSSTTSFDVGEEVVSPYLWQRGVARLDIVVLSHAHSDHMGGMEAVLTNFHPRELWISRAPQSAAFQHLLQTAHTLHIPVRTLHAADALSWSGTQITALAPANSNPTGAPPTNDDSLVLRVAWKQHAILLEGDAEADSEARMLQAPISLASDVLKIGHHGSRTSTTEPFLNAVDPHFALISDGRFNTFGHPRIEVLQRLQQHHVLVYRTDMLGAITVKFNGDGPTEVESHPR